jgi:SAM-dependent methyltransferase
MHSEEKADWFVTWFDDPNYHKLYAHRSTAEAQAFMSALQSHFDWPASRIIDMGCGKGRHAEALAALVLDDSSNGSGSKSGARHEVLGVDLSPASIESASFRTRKLSAANGLQFKVGDMRDFSSPEPFDIALSLFTSFGYFDEPSDNAQVVSNFSRLLHPGGMLVLDFLNVAPAKRELIASERIEREGTTYSISRRFSPDPAPGHFYKTIKWKGGEQTERVQALGLADLRGLLVDGGFDILHIFGDYNLNAFDAERSPRCLLVARLNS